jgi:subtilisin-like proprotein convertase family protein
MKNLLLRYTGFIAVILFIWIPQSHAQRYWNVAAKFQGYGTSYVTVIPSDSLKNLKGNFTVECWFYCDTAVFATLFGDFGLRLLLDPVGTNKVRGRIQTASSSKLYTKLSTAMEVRKWYHLACVYNSAVYGNMMFFINGEPDSSRMGVDIGAVASTDSFFIGKADSYGAFKGMLDDIRVWNRALSWDDIKYNMRNPLVSIYNKPPNFGTGCVLAASFDNTYTGDKKIYFYDSQNTFYPHNVGSYYLGGHPSQTLAINSALDLNYYSYVLVPNNNNIDISGAMTMEAWIYPTYASSDERGVIVKKSDFSANGYAMYFTTEYNIPEIRYMFNGSVLYTKTPIPLNQWSHIAASVSQTGYSKLYINGVLDNELQMETPKNNTDSLYIGSIKNGGFYDGFVGYIDGVNISNFEKSQNEIIQGMFKIVDQSNKPALPKITSSFNFDYYNFATTGTSDYYFKGGAKYSYPVSVAGVPVSPIAGNNLTNFPVGYFVKNATKRIPQLNSSGNMIDDSIYISTTAPMSSVKLFLSLNHTNLTDLKISLIAPTGDEIIVWNQQYGVNTNVQNITTIFDDYAADALQSKLYVDFGPTIKPLNPLNTVLAGKNPRGIWRLRITDLNTGDTGFLYGWGLSLNDVNGINNNLTNEIPGQYQFDQNYPNPWNPSTVIKYSVPASSLVILKVYDILGNEIKTLVNEEKPTGSYEVTWAPANLPSGVYLYRIEARSTDNKNNFSSVKKMIFLK